MAAIDIKITLDFRSGTPIYIQIMEQVRMIVARGELQQGDQLPTVRKLATDLRINWNTVSRAYRLLDNAGLITTQRGRGTYLLKAPREELSSPFRQQVLEDLTKRHFIEAARLGCSSQDITRAFEKHMGLWKAGELLDY